jgi:hypothetical protein
MMPSLGSLDALRLFRIGTLALTRLLTSIFLFFGPLLLVELLASSTNLFLSSCRVNIAS